MALRSTASTVALLLFVGLILVMVVGYQVGQPILLGFVLTGSMSPTLEPGDGFVAVPPSLAGEVEEGDVVTFDAQELEGGGLTTHRIVGRTNEGFITRGDANPFTDQDGPEPPVQRSQIVAVALELNGDVVVIPGLGTFALAVQGIVEAASGVFQGVPVLGGLADGDVGSTMVGIGVAVLVLSFVPGLFGRKRESEARSRSREGVWRASLLLVVILLLIVLPVTANMVVPSGTQEITIISSSTASENPLVIQVGTSRDVTFNVTNNGFVPRIVILEPAGPGIEVAETTLVVDNGETANTTVTIHAADETGSYVRSLSERHYLRFLPVPVIVALHEIHPYVAILAIDLTIATVVVVLFLFGFGLRPLRIRSRDRDLPIADRFNRAVRKWL